MSALHDLRCPGCDHEEMDVRVEDGRYPDCKRCGTRMTWIPRGFATDVAGSEQASEDLWVPGTNRPITWTSSRERDKKMHEMHGVYPRGDRVNGARVSEEKLGKSIVSFGAGKGGRHRSSKRGKKHGSSQPAA